MGQTSKAYQEPRGSPGKGGPFGRKLKLGGFRWENRRFFSSFFFSFSEFSASAFFCGLFLVGLVVGVPFSPEADLRTAQLVLSNQQSLGGEIGRLTSRSQSGFKGVA